jgi:hypothetical protein
VFFQVLLHVASIFFLDLYQAKNHHGSIEKMVLEYNVPNHLTNSGQMSGVS